MSEEGDSSVQGVGNDNDLIEPNKAKHKIIRVLTVVAYALSVSMAAILLSIYYVFMWDGHPTLARKDSSQQIRHLVDVQPYQPQLPSVLPQLAAYAALTRGAENGTDSNIGTSSNDTKVTMMMMAKEMWPLQNSVFDNTSEENTAEENVLVDVPYEPTAIPVVEAKTESPPLSTPDPIVLNEEVLNEGDWPMNITFAQHLPVLTKRSPMFRKLVQSSIMD